MQVIPATFDVRINPFEKEICVKQGSLETEHTHIYKDNDEWFSYSFDGIKYDFHFLYDMNKLSFCVYQVNVDNEADYSKTIPINLHVEIGI